MTLHDTFIKALMDTLMGMGTVFLILIVICIIISLFKFIHKDEPAAAAAGPVQTETGVPDADDDSELMAVIMAALRMAMAGERRAEDTSDAQDGPVFIVRSVRRRR